MATPKTQADKIQMAAEDAGKYFHYMADFVGFTQQDAQAIKESQLIIEKHLPNIVAKFYDHLLRYPPTRKHFLKADGSVDPEYVQKRMQHLTNFWRRAASGEYDDEFARYVDYVGRAHTRHGADPNIYIAERYVIGQVGFMQHAISQALIQELHEYDPDLERRATRAWNVLMMVILELLARVYGDEHEVESHQTDLMVDTQAVHQLAVDAYEIGLGLTRPKKQVEVKVAQTQDIPDGERKIVQVEGRSIGVFHHKGNWYALTNHCLHAGGPVATGGLEKDTLTCPWHGYQYKVTTGELLADPGVKLEMYPVIIQGDEVVLRVPQLVQEIKEDTAPQVAKVGDGPKENEFRFSELVPGKTRLVHVDGQAVAVYNVSGKLYATQNNCTHAGGPLNEGDLEGQVITCPWHGSCFDVTNGEVRCGPAKMPVKTYTVEIKGDIVRVE